MKKNINSGIIGAIIGILVTTAVILSFNHFLQTSTDDSIEQTEKSEDNVTENAKENKEVKVKDQKKEEVGVGVEQAKIINPEKQPTPQSVTQQKKTVKPQAVNRIYSKVMHGNFSMTGRGEDAKWGIGRAANFKYNLFFSAESKIISKKTQQDGSIKIIEKRKFGKVVDSVVASNVDFKLNLSTVPVNTFRKAVGMAAIAYASLTGEPIGTGLVETTNFALKYLQTLDGKSLRGLLGLFDISPTVEMEETINKLVSSSLTRALHKTRAISDKSYIFTYIQEANGQPLYITVKNSDGSDITNEEEKLMLKRVNSFIDYNLVPNENCKQGDTWTISAEDIQEIFDPFADGKYEGNISVSRLDNYSNGDWTIKMQPSAIKVVADNGTTTGNLIIKKGKAFINPANICVNELQISGQAKLNRATKHHLLFTARMNGMCDFEGRIVTTQKEK